ncbi:MAG: GAF domain-containing protein, partial [Anaerolineaceae bacterium]
MDIGLKDSYRQGIFDQVTMAHAEQGTKLILEENRELLVEILTISADAIILIDNHQRIIYFNQGAERIFGYTSSEIIGHPLARILPEENRSIHQKHVTDFFHFTRLSRQMGSRLEVAGRRKNGEVFPAEASISVSEQSGKQIFAAILRDVTIRKQREEQLRHYREELEKLVEVRAEELTTTNQILQQSLSELARLNELSRLLSNPANLESVLSDVSRVIWPLFDAHGAVINVIQDIPGIPKIVGQCQSNSQSVDSDQRTSIPVEPAAIKLALGISKTQVARRLIEDGRSIMIPDAQKDPRISELRTRLQTCGVSSLMMVPLLALGQTIGMLMISSAVRHREFTSREVALAETIAGQIANALENFRLFHNEQRQRQRAESLQKLAAILNESLERPAVMTTILEQLCQVMNFDGAAIIQRHGDAFAVSDAVGISQRYLGLQMPVTNNHLPARMMRQGELANVDDSAVTPDWIAWGQDTTVDSRVGIPLMVDNDIRGFLSIHNYEPRQFSQDDVSLLQAFADQTAVALANINLYKQAQQVAAGAERERLARELHDAVTQSLFSANIISEALPLQWQQDPEAALENLQKLRQLIQGSLAEMRTLLLELRPGVLVETALEELLEQLIAAMISQSNVHFSLELESSTNELLPPATQLTFFRVAQEALNNMVKHAEANQASLYLRRQPGRVELTIRDDGLGFNPCTIPPGH